VMDVAAEFENLQAVAKNREFLSAGMAAT